MKRVRIPGSTATDFSAIPIYAIIGYFNKDDLCML